jgi:hypothetical protein
MSFSGRFKSDQGKKILIIVLTALFGVGGMVGSVYGARSYGLSLFVGVPVLMGVVSAFVGRVFRLSGTLSCVLVSACSTFLARAILILTHLEGLICLFMAWPLAFPFRYVGAKATSAFIEARRRPATYALFVILPLLFTADLTLPVPIHTQIEVAAPPEIVWKNVVKFPDLPDPDEFLFSAGLAYPKRARVVGRGPGAVRYCEFSTGAFVEPIRVWEENKLLRFEVTSSPEPLREISPYGDRHPPHLNGYFTSRQGRFLLTRLRNGHTLSSGTTWYELRIGPGPYWRIWADCIVHKIHLRVLRHIQRLSEKC